MLNFVSRKKFFVFLAAIFCVVTMQFLDTYALSNSGSGLKVDPENWGVFS